MLLLTGEDCQQVLQGVAVAQTLQTGHFAPAGELQKMCIRDRQYGVLVPAIAALTRRVVMNWWPGTDGTEQVNWQKKRPCR